MDSIYEDDFLNDRDIYGDCLYEYEDEYQEDQSDYEHLEEFEYYEDRSVDWEKYE